ncbi:MAG: metal-dependent hydrolase [Halobacteriota archaeon]
MKITWHGHAFFELEAANGTQILIDPFIENNPTTDLTVDDFDPDIVAVTHGDYFDHACEAHKFDTHVLCQSMMARALTLEEGHEDVTDLNLGGMYEYEGVSFLMTHGFHSIGTALPDVDRVHYDGVAAGYIVDDGETKFYHSGDTCLFGDLKTVIGDVYDPDIAAVPIGGHHTMEAEHAAVAVNWTGVDAAIPMHYDTFPDVDADPQVFVDGVNDAEVFVMDSGETIEYTA